MAIKTDSKGLEEPKDPDTCLVFDMYTLFSTAEQQEELAAKYRAGNFGYGHAKQELFLLLDSKLEEARDRYNDLMNRKDYVYDVLNSGAKKSRAIAKKTLTDVRQAVGL